MNKQPFYHRSEGALTFTATKPISESEFIKAVEKALKPLGLVSGTVDIECIHDEETKTLFSGWMEPEAGDPSDLM
jgi:hypothetical protein